MGVASGVAVAVGAGVAVAVDAGVAVAVDAGVAVGAGVAVAVDAGVAVGAGVAVAVGAGAAVAVDAGVAVAVDTGVAVASDASSCPDAGMAHCTSAKLASPMICSRVAAGPIVQLRPSTQVMVAYHLVVLLVRAVPPPVAQVALIHTVAAADADARLVKPDPLLLPVPMRQLALQPYVVVVLVSDVPPPAGQVALIHTVAAADANARLARPEPLLLPAPMRQLAIQPYVVALLVRDVPPPCGQVATHARASAVAAAWVRRSAPLPVLVPMLQLADQ